MKYTDFEKDVLSNGGFEELAQLFIDKIKKSDVYTETLELLVDDTLELAGVRPTDISGTEVEAHLWFDLAVETMLMKQLAANFEAEQGALEDLHRCEVCDQLNTKTLCTRCGEEMDKMTDKMDALKDKYGRPNVRKLG